MSKVLTYKWKSQPYISWKGLDLNDLSHNQFNVAVPVEKRPVVNAVATMGNSKSSSYFGPSQQATSAPAVQVGRNSRVGGYSYDASGNQKIMGGVGARARHFGPQPLKHWRRQLNPDNKSGFSKASVASLMDRPGGSINLNSSSGPLSGCKGCDLSGNSLYAIQYLNNKGPINPKNQGQYQLDSSGNPYGPCIACDPVKNRIKSAVTLLNKNYYTDTNAYLKSRCMTYDQKLSITDISNNHYYDTNGNIIYPTNSQSGSQVFNMLNCCADKCSKRQITIYKPNNTQFAVQGAVSSSGRIAKLKYDTITKNGASFRTAYGQQGANAGKYAASSNAPYFLKSKENIGTPAQGAPRCPATTFHRNGNKNVKCPGQPTPQQLGMINVPGRKSGCRGPTGQKAPCTSLIFG